MCSGFGNYVYSVVLRQEALKNLLLKLVFYLNKGVPGNVKEISVNNVIGDT